MLKNTLRIVKGKQISRPKLFVVLSKFFDSLSIILHELETLIRVVIFCDLPLTKQKADCICVKRWFPSITVVRKRLKIIYFKLCFSALPKRFLANFLDFYVIYRGIREKGSGDVVSAVCYTICTLSIYPSAHKQLRHLQNPIHNPA